MLRSVTRRIVRPSPSAIRIPFAFQARQKHYMNVTAKDFADRISDKSNQNMLLVDFFATWCRPCHMLSPVLETAVESSKDKFGKELDLMTVDTDQEGELAAQYRVTALPTVIAFKDGKPISVFQGAIPQSKVEEFIENLYKS